jgi:hypothetical protein
MAPTAISKKFAKLCETATPEMREFARAAICAAYEQAHDDSGYVFPPDQVMDGIPLPPAADVHETNDEVEKAAQYLRASRFKNESDMLVELATRLRQEEEENRRDPVSDPRMGDRMITPCGWEWVYVPDTGNYAYCHAKHWARELRLFPSATVIRRRELRT